MSIVNLCISCRNNDICKGFAIQKELLGIANMAVSACTRYNYTANLVQEKTMATVPIRDLEKQAEMIRKAELKNKEEKKASEMTQECPICGDKSDEEFSLCSKCGRSVCPACIMEELNPDTKAITQVCSECW